LQDKQLITVQGKIYEQTPLIRGAYPAIQVTQAVLFTAQFIQFVNEHEILVVQLVRLPVVDF